MIQHNGDKTTLHIHCSYIYQGEICRLLNKDRYPNVVIRLPNGQSKSVNASVLFHISLNDDILDAISDDFTLSSTSPKRWTFNDKIPAFIFRSGEIGKYLLTNALAQTIQPLPVFTLDALQYIRHNIQG